MTQLARSYGSSEWARIDDLAKIEEIPSNYLVQILNDLRNSGLVTSRRGKMGGYALAKPPQDITLLEIAKVIEGELLEINNPQKGKSGPRVSEIWQDIVTTLEEKTKNYSLDTFLLSDSNDMYYI